MQLGNVNAKYSAHIVGATFRRFSKFRIVLVVCVERDVAQMQNTGQKLKHYVLLICSECTVPVESRHTRQGHGVTMS